ncbi:MAG TPA: imidazolonepropionase, partial [Acidimicrobiales bacterium]|nr:imidazolonepropionase [Acidimicrobiales bacterium]
RDQGGDVLTTVVAIDNIGLLVTGDEELGDGPLGIVRDVALVAEDGMVAAIERAGAAADRRIDAGGRCVIPGFVDSHTHLVFAGDRSDEFAARMAGTPYSAGGIRSTVAATRAAPTEELGADAALRRYAALLSGTTHLEIKSGYGLDVENERRLVEVASGITDDVTFLGAHAVPPEFAGKPDAYVDLVCGAMLAACAPHSRWIDVFCEEGAFDVDQSRAVLRAGKSAGLGLRVHANQLGFGGGVRLAVEEGAASADHCTYLSDDDVDALASSSTVATFLPASDFSTRQPYPDARRLIDAGATVAIATNCNPGSSYTSAMAFCIALAVRDMHMTPDQALWAATKGGAAALRRPELGWLGPGSRADAVILDAPTHVHLASRPGMALVREVINGGARVPH